MQARDGELAEPSHDSTPCKASQGDQEGTRGPEPEPAVEGEGNGVETMDEVVHCFSTEPVDVPTCLHMALFLKFLCVLLWCACMLLQPPQSTSKPSEVARRMQQQLEEMREAPREQRKRRSKRLMRLEEAPPPPPSHHRSPAPGKPRRSRRNRKKEEPLMDSQVSDSQLLQVTYDDPEGRREKAKLMAQIER